MLICQIIMPLVLGYGSLTPRRMCQRVGRVEVVRGVRLRNMRVVFQGAAPRFEYGGVATLVPARGDHDTVGILFHLTPGQLQMLDEVEQVGMGLTVRRWLRRPQCWIYLRRFQEEPNPPSPRYASLHRELRRCALRLLAQQDAREEQ